MRASMPVSSEQATVARILDRRQRVAESLNHGYATSS